MAPPVAKAPTTLAVIVRLCELGCVVRNLSGDIQLEEGTYAVRYVRNPRTSGLWICSEYEDDEELGPSVIGVIEKLLGVKTGFPSRPQRGG